MATHTMTTSPEARRASGTAEAAPSIPTRRMIQNAIRYALRVPEAEARTIASVAIDLANSLRIYGHGTVTEYVVRRTMESAMTNIAMDIASEWRYISFTDPAVVALSGPILRYADTLL